MKPIKNVDKSYSDIFVVIFLNLTFNENTYWIVKFITRQKSGAIYLESYKASRAGVNFIKLFFFVTDVGTKS